MAEIKVTSTQLSGKMRGALYLATRPPLWAWVASALAHAGAIMSIGVMYKPVDVKHQKPAPQEGMVVNVAPDQNHFREQLETPPLPVCPSIDASDDRPAEFSSLPSPELPELPEMLQPDIPVFRTRDPVASVRLHLMLPPENVQPVEPPVEQPVEQVADDAATVEATPEITENPPPVYPRIARMRGYEGLVVLEVAVSADGSCTGVEVIESSGYDILDQAAVDAVGKWEFKPALANGAAVSGKVRVPIRFKLTD